MAYYAETHGVSYSKKKKKKKKKSEDQQKLHTSSKIETKR
jgi:hypothetical protein